MAVIKAQANGNWSNTATWSGGVIPSANDTVYANGYTITIDQNIDLTGTAVDQSGSLIVGQIYQVVSIGNTNFGITSVAIIPGTNAATSTAISNAANQIFQATGVGTATTGTARRMGALCNHLVSALSIVTGGGFVLSSNYNITGAYIIAGSANCLTINNNASNTITDCYAIGSPATQSTRAILFSSTGTLTCSQIRVNGGRVTSTSAVNGSHGIGATSTGNITFQNASTVTGGSAAFCYGIYATGSTVFSFAGGCVTTGGSASNSWAIINNSTSPITYTGGSILGSIEGSVSNAGTMSVTGSTITGSAGHAITNSGNLSNLTISGSVITGGSTEYGIHNSSTGSVVITTSTVTGGSGVTGYGVYNASTGTVSIQGDITASNNVNGFYGTSTSAIVTLCGSQTSSSNGFAAVMCPKFLVDPTPTTARVRFAKDGISTYSDFYTVDNGSFGMPSVSDVRSGTTFANGTLAGTCVVPAAGSVALGVPVDNTSGTAVLTTEAIWNTLTATLTASNSIGERLKNVSTVAVTSEQLAAALSI